MMASPTNNVPTFRMMLKFSNMVNKPHYEGSDATETYHSYCDKDNGHIKYKKVSSTIEDADSLNKLSNI